MSDFDDVELSIQGEQAADGLLMLIGDVAKLAVLLAELPEEEIQLLSKRLGIFLSTVESLPVKLADPDPCNWGNTVGEA